MKNLLINKILPSLVLLFVGFGAGMAIFKPQLENQKDKLIISFDLGYQEGYHKATEDLAYLNQFGKE